MNDTWILPAEWEQQWGVQLTWPHDGTDWLPYLDEITATYIQMAQEIAAREHLIVVAPDVARVQQLLAGKVNMERVVFHQCATDDTWARDHGFITLKRRARQEESADGKGGMTAQCGECGGPEAARLLDFCFNGWGEKFEWAHDNAINASLLPAIRPRLAAAGGDVSYCSHLDFVLEGGSIESDGRGTIFTTTQCLMAPHRNQPLNRRQIEQQLKHRLHADRILWIDNGHLAGDDTDGHIDTLVRIAPDDTLLYIECRDTEDEHFADLQAMEAQLKTLRTREGRPYRLLPLPMPAPIFDGTERLPATYANFLIINGAVLVPTYGQPSADRQAIDTIRQAFPGRTMIPIDSRTIIRQHGSIHCCTMQFPL